MINEWLGSEIGYIPKTVTLEKGNALAVDENGRKIVKSGTLYTDANLGKGLIVNDADVTDENRPVAMMIRGTYRNDKLPTKLDDATVTELAQKGLYDIKYAPTNVTYGEVNG